MASQTLKNVAMQRFLDRYRIAQAQLATQEIDNLKSQLASLRPSLDGALVQRAERARHDASTFNIFSILGVKRRESAHSNFLADLLDPSGKHGQGVLFLKSFLMMCSAKTDGSWLDAEAAATGEVSVNREAAVFEGRCDLLIYARSLCLLIENKIKAKEGDEQLSRYWKWLCGQPRATNKLLVFLTPDGRRSRDPNFPVDRYMRLSFSEVRVWLQDCMVQIPAASVRFATEQYIQVLAEEEKQIHA